MSIAVSTVVLPSRQLAVLMGGFCLGLAGVAVLLVFGAAIDAPPAVRAALALVLAVVPVWLSRAAIWRGKSLRIDISDYGEITVAEDEACTIEGMQAGREQDAGGAVVRLLPDSTIWPYLLLLRLQADDRRVRNVLILRDCMSAEKYRALSVACHWIAAHNGQAKH
ncbi:protein YgfX [Noviherbaspirillum sedimenti]|uniref:Flagellar hook-length control protein n=1 Tax=Noviherbaspirillum sedimenti TaxID=2320865 RepID=A0A3A3G187_9BURK|nr:protein YgfX [Noviherbaspirillum sedimenti]RJG01395.1 hypothetical protein D3878_07200 [Noviherbaspirillum sedimenti]